MSDEKHCAACSTRMAHHNVDLKKEIDRRLARIEGQIRGIRGMVQGDIYCDDVLNQITSAQAALSGVRLLLLENHIRSCVADQLAEGHSEVVDELMKTIGRMSK